MDTYIGIIFSFICYTYNFINKTKYENIVIDYCY